LCVNFINLNANLQILAFPLCIAKRSGVPLYFYVMFADSTVLVQSGTVDFWAQIWGLTQSEKFSQVYQVFKVLPPDVHESLTRLEYKEDNGTFLNLK
jgi:hypothetical protein